jgi:hypothetical protein
MRRQGGFNVDILGKPKAARGDIVSYHGRRFFFQPLGATCALYQKREDIGNMEKATHTPSSRCVFMVKRERDITEEDEKVVEDGRLCEQEPVWDC